MASCTLIFKRRKRLKARKAGRDRKHAWNKYGTTPSQAVFFGDAAVETDKKPE